MRIVLVLSRLQFRIRVLFLTPVLLSILAVPFLSPSHTAAASMDRMDHNSAAVCTTFCARANGSSLPEQGVLNEEETPEPLPIPPENTQYYLQFIAPDVPKTIKPSQHFTANPIHPPDRVVWLTNFRF